MRVLLVEDEARLAEIVRAELAESGITVDVENEGPTGLWRATEGSYDAVVLDIMLPGLNGYEVCRQLREQRVWTPVLMLTAKDGEFDEAEALDIGADDFLRKPFSLVVLTARLRAIVRRGTPARPTVLTCDSLRVDPATHAVTVDGASVDVTPREFSILEVLLRADGAAVSVEQLLDRVWGIDADPMSNVVQVNVASLRRKIDHSDRPSLIRTVRGAGYLMTEPSQ